MDAPGSDGDHTNTGTNTGATAPGSQAAAGWYPDPHEPGTLRYFDGQVWTEHRHNEGGGLPAIGSWLSSTFSVVAENFVPAALLSFGLQLIGAALVWLIVRMAVGDLAVENETLVNFDATEAAWLAIMVVVVALWRGFSNVARDRFLQRAHMQAGPTIADALQRGVVRLPKWIGAYLLVAIGWFVALFVAGLVFAFAGPALGLLVFVLLGLLAIWVWVRLAFISVAVAAAPAKQSVFASSLDISRNRFWPVFGRLLLVIVGAAIIGQLVGWMSQGITASLDSNAFAERVSIEPTETELLIEVEDFELTELLPSLQSFLVFGAIAALLGSLLALVASSAMVRLYLEAGGDSDVGANSASSGRD